MHSVPTHIDSERGVSLLVRRVPACRWTSLRFDLPSSYPLDVIHVLRSCEHCLKEIIVGYDAYRKGDRPLAIGIERERRMMIGLKRCALSMLFDIVHPQRHFWSSSEIYIRIEIVFSGSSLERRIETVGYHQRVGPAVLVIQYGIGHYWVLILLNRGLYLQLFQDIVYGSVVDITDGRYRLVDP